MSSHREAPEISKDPVADSTDLYAFRSPDRPGYVTIISNYIPLQNPAGGPNFFEFGDDVAYRINIDNNGDGVADIVYEFRFTTQVLNPDTFLYNTGPITALGDAAFNRPQFYDVTRTKNSTTTTIGTHLPCPPCNIGPRSTPNYAHLAASAVRPLTLGNGSRVFCGQRLDGFYVDLGSVFDLLGLRPLNDAHLLPMAKMDGVDGLRSYNVHTIALQVPIGELTSDGSVPTDQALSKAVIGVWTSAHRQQALVRNPEGADTASGPWIQVSRLGNPLVNEALIPMSRKDAWNSALPSADADYAQYVQHPELAGLIPVLYPGAFPHLAGFSGARADLDAILLTGLPTGVIPSFQNNTGATKADMLRLNVAIPPAAMPSIMGILGGDLAGYPNGRRVADNVFAIALRAIAGATLPLVAPSFVPDPAAGAVTDGLTPPGNVSYLPYFPYLDHPRSGYEVMPPSVPAPAPVP
jgi:hypothetical protein